MKANRILFMNMSKGQHTIVREVFLFAIGVAITSFIVLSFNNVKNTSTNLALEDQMTKVANTVAGSVIKLSQIKDNSTIKLSLPEKLSEEIYIIKMNENGIRVYIFENPSINITKKMFNITKSYVISGEVVSTGKFFEIVSENSNIWIRRAVI